GGGRHPSPRLPDGRRHPDAGEPLHAACTPLGDGRAGRHPPPRRERILGAVARGAEVEAARQGRAVRLEPYPTTREGLENFLGGVRAERPGLLVAAGRLADDVAVARALRRRRIVVPTALVAAGVRAFGEALGAAADGFVGPSQWEPTAPLAPDLGPT